MGFTYEKLWGQPKKTETAGTVINVLIPGKKDLVTYLNFFSYTDAGTAHTLAMMRSTGDTRTTAAAAASATTVVVAADPGPTGNGIAASDYIAIELADGSWHLSTVSSWNSSTLTITLNTAIPSTTTVLSGAKVVFFGVVGDSAHDNSKVSGGSSSSRVDFPPVAIPGALVASRASNDPILLQSNNASNAGTFSNVCAGYGR